MDRGSFQKLNVNLEPLCLVQFTRGDCCMVLTALKTTLWLLEGSLYLQVVSGAISKIISILTVFFMGSNCLLERDPQLTKGEQKRDPDNCPRGKHCV